MEETLSIRLLKYRRMKGISQGDFARLLGVKQSVISYYENGRRKPSRERLRKIAEILGVDLCEFNEEECELVSSIVENSEKMTDEELIDLKRFSDYILWKRNN